MRNVFCIASRYVCPSVKRRLVEILYKEKMLSQTQIARKLYISQSAVSRYLAMKRGSYLDIAICLEIDNEIKKLAEILTQKDIEELKLEKLILRIVLKAMGSGCICRFHKQIDPTIDPNKCNICKELFGEHANWTLNMNSHRNH